MKPAPIDPPQIHHLLWKDADGIVGWDVGVNTGHTSAYMLRHWQRVVGFEPAAECWPTLDDFAAKNPRFTLVKEAVSDLVGEVALTVLPDKIDTGQLVTSDCDGMEWDTHQRAAEQRRVPCGTLDSYWATHDSPDFIKIDVEGHELKVLHGGEALLDACVPGLLVEFHSPELHAACQTFLEDLGYDVETVRHPHYPLHSQFWHQHGWIRATYTPLDSPPSDR